MQAPSQRIKSRPVLCATYRPKLASGAKIISLSAGMDSTIWTALDEVQMISVIALMSAEQLMYETTTAFGFAAFKAANSSTGTESANEQPALKSGTMTFFVGFRILAVSPMK